MLPNYECPLFFERNKTQDLMRTRHNIVNDCFFDIFYQLSLRF